MTTPYLVADIKRDEGCRLHAYPDPRTGADPWTIGYGHTGREVHPGLVWSQIQCDSQLVLDVGTTQRGLDTALPWWRGMTEARQDVVVNMAFNMGIHGLLGFHVTLGDMEQGDYESAARGMLQSDWADQTGERAVRLAEQMKTGVRA